MITQASSPAAARLRLGWERALGLMRIARNRPGFKGVGRRLVLAPSWPTAATLVVVATITSVNIWWATVGRSGQVLSIDEDGYLAFAYNDYFNLRTGGLHAWWSAFNATGPHSPIVPAAAGFLFQLFGTSVHVALVVPAVAGAGIVWLTYLCARALANTRAALLSMALVATAPVLAVYARNFIFAAPVALVVAGAMWALVRSQALKSLGWCVLFGVCLGMMPLVRTMGIAYVPGLMAAAIVSLSSSESRKRSIRNFALAILLSAATASLWLPSHARLVYHYLTDYGYGKASSGYSSGGSTKSPLSPGAWLDRLRSIAADLHGPHVVLILAGVVAGGILVASQSRRLGYRLIFRSLSRSPLLVPFVVSVEGLAALFSSRNSGTGFMLPILPAIAIVSAVGLDRAISKLGSRLRRALPIALCAILCVPFVASVDVNSAFAEPRVLRIPGFGVVPVTDGRLADQTSLQNAYPERRFPDEMSPKEEANWTAVNARSSRELDALRAKTGEVALGFEHYYYNVGSLQLSYLRQTHSAMWLAQLDPVRVSESVAAYTAWLMTGSGADACVLLTLDSSEGQYEPRVDAAHLATAASGAGFRQVDSWALPDSGLVRAWQRSRTCP